jgi:hypothetical protein
VWTRTPRCAECGRKLRPDDQVALATSTQQVTRAALAELGKLPADAIIWHEDCFARMAGPRVE